MSNFEWPDEAREAADPWEVFKDTDGHNSIRGRGAEDILAALLPFVKDALAAEYQRGQRDGYYDGWRDCSAGDWTVIDQMRRGTDEVQEQ